MKFRSWISLLLCIIMLLGTVCLSGCSGITELFKKPNADVLEESESTPEESEAPPARIALVENGKAVYTVVYPNDADYTVLNAMDKFIAAVKDATGVKLNSKSDNLRPGQTRDENAKEILFGKTNYTESQEALKNMYADEYVIKAVGSKIIIASPDNSYLLAAVNYYTKKLMKNNLVGEAGSYTLYLEEYHFVAEGADKVLNINGKKIEDYVIVYESSRSGYKEAAEYLQSCILQYGKVNIPVYKDTDRTAGEAEFLVGKTNRTLSKNCYKDFVDLLSYRVVIEGGLVQLVSGGPFSARGGAGDMAFKMLAGGSKMGDGTYYETDMKVRAFSLTAGADVRIMTSNVLANMFVTPTSGDYIPSVPLRAEIAAALLVTYKPDVVGLQEVDAPWSAAIGEYAEILKTEYGLEYGVLHDRYQNKQNLTCIIYRADKYAVEDSGVEVSSFWTSGYTYHMRNITWAIFRNKTDSKRFMVANNHWAHESNEWREISSNQLAKFVNNNSFSGPIFCTGDFNAKPQVLDTDLTDDGELYYPAFQNFMDQTEARWLKDEAKANGVLANEIGGCGLVGSVRGKGNYIDHIFGVGSFTLLRYETVVGTSAHWMSDHSPQFADIKL